MICWFVHQEDVWFVEKELGDADSGAFAAAEEVDGFVDVVAAEEHEARTSLTSLMVTPSRSAAASSNTVLLGSKSSSF